MSVKDLINRNRQQRIIKVQEENKTEGYYNMEKSELEKLKIPIGKEEETIQEKDDIYEIGNYEKYLIDDEFIITYNEFVKEFGQPHTLTILLKYAKDEEYVKLQELDNELAEMFELMNTETKLEREKRELIEKQKEDIENRMKNKPMVKVWKEMLQKGIMKPNGDDITTELPIILHSYKIDEKSGAIFKKKIHEKEIEKDSVINYLPIKKLKRKSKMKSKDSKLSKSVIHAIQSLDSISDDESELSTKLRNKIEKEKLGIKMEETDDESGSDSEEGDSINEYKEILNLEYMKFVFKQALGKDDYTEDSFDSLNDQEKAKLAIFLRDLEATGKDKEIQAVMDQEIKRAIKEKSIKKRKENILIAEYKRKQKLKEKRFNKEYGVYDELYEENKKLREEEKRVNEQFASPELLAMYESEKDQFFKDRFPDLAEQGVTPEMFNSGFAAMIPSMKDNPNLPQIEYQFRKAKLEMSKGILEKQLPTLIDQIQEMTESIPENQRKKVFEEIIGAEIPEELKDATKAREFLAKRQDLTPDKQNKILDMINELKIERKPSGKASNLLAKLMGVEDEEKSK